MEAGYDSCCAHGFCAGYPATCSCNPDCHDFGDCCSDIDTVCPAGMYTCLKVDIFVHEARK